MSKPVILTGLRANNDLHIGNYFGALLPLIDMAKTRADEYEVNLMLADLHSFVTPIEHSELQKQIQNTLRLYAAAGMPLDHPGIRIFRQSYVPAHSELTWILDCFTGMGQMSRMTQYKDKAAKLGEDQINVGLFNYPVLMACDILLYNTHYVPVGEDQTQHIEYTRDIAERMNSKFARELFTLPEPVAKQHEFFHGLHSLSAEGGKDQPSSRLRPAGQGLRIKDLQDPTKKMSKSDESGKGIIFLGDSPEAAAKKIHSAATDSFGRIDVDSQDQPGIVNLMQILALATGNSYEDIKAHYTGQTQYGPLKIDAAVAISEFLHAFQDRLAAVDETMLTEKLRADEVKMNEIAKQTLLRVQKAVGLR